MLTTIVYSSKATYPMENSELVAMLNKSRSSNEKNNITGLLLYEDGYFLQVLEGETQELEQLFENIRQDNRHYEIITYWKVEINERKFGDWKMGFINLDLPEYEHLAGFTDFLYRHDKPEEWTNNPSEIYMLLINFRAKFVTS